MSHFSIINLPLDGLKIVKRKQLGDERGFLSRVFCSKELELAGWCGAIDQINHTYTAKIGTVRGLHFQYPPHAEMKLVSVIRGRIWDVVVDIRANSPTFLHWHAEKLSAEDNNALLIPEGFAHGFQALSGDVELLYCHSMPYNKEGESGLNLQDPKLAISLPLAISEISKRDREHPLLDEVFTGILL